MNQKLTIYHSKETKMTGFEITILLLLNPILGHIYMLVRPSKQKRAQYQAILASGREEFKWEMYLIVPFALSFWLPAVVLGGLYRLLTAGKQV